MAAGVTLELFRLVVCFHLSRHSSLVESVSPSSLQTQQEHQNATKRKVQLAGAVQSVWVCWGNYFLSQLSGSGKKLLWLLKAKENVSLGKRWLQCINHAIKILYSALFLEVSVVCNFLLYVCETQEAVFISYWHHLFLICIRRNITYTKAYSASPFV